MSKQALEDLLPAKGVSLVLADAVRCLVAENEALRKDAERYRWLRDTPWIGTPIESVITQHANALWDSAIDAAMEAKHG